MRKNTFLRLIDETRQQLTTALREHALLHVQTKMLMDQTRSQLQHHEIDNKISHAEKHDHLTAANFYRNRLELIDEKLKVIIRDHNGLFDNVVMFNTVVLSMGEEHQGYFIRFDEVMAKLFEDQYERFNHSGDNIAKRIPNQPRWV